METIAAISNAEHFKRVGATPVVVGNTDYDG